MQSGCRIATAAIRSADSTGLPLITWMPRSEVTGSMPRLCPVAMIHSASSDFLTPQKVLRTSCSLTFAISIRSLA